MIDYTPILIKAFADKDITILHADFADSNTKTPYFTYRETNNSDNSVGDTVGYSDIQYTIEVWGRNYAEFIANCKTADKIMHGLRFHRIGTTEQAYQGLYRKITVYNSLKKESF